MHRLVASFRKQCSGAASTSVQCWCGSCLACTACLQVCSVLHQQYAEFGRGVVRAFGGALAAGAAEGEQSVVRRRTLLRLLAQLLLAGVSSEWAVLVQVDIKPSYLDTKHARVLAWTLDAVHAETEMPDVPSGAICNFPQYAAGRPSRAW